jgi:hypothetical protein
MARPSFATLATLLVVPLAAGSGWAQETQKVETPPAAEAARPEKTPGRPERGPTATLRVLLVLSRFQGERKLASLPYTLLVTANGNKARMRMGVETPVPVTQLTPSESGSVTARTTSYQYKNVGTNLDCGARDLGDGRYQLMLGVENSSTLAGSENRAAVGGDLATVPFFRKFETTLDPVLRDGQSVQAVASTDPVTGEVVKIDVTMNVVR